MRNYLFILVLFCCAITVNAQVGGRDTYAFLKLTNSARAAALGGKNISLPGDVNLVYQNPALLSPSMDGHIALDYVNYFMDINYGYTSVTKHVKGIGTFGGGLQHINYGKFIKADETGTITGQFLANEFAIQLQYAMQLDSNFSVGVNFKPIISHLSEYQSYGFATDYGLLYNNQEKQFTAALVIRDVGLQLWSYTENNRESLPFEIQLGVSQKLQHAPFRISLTAQQLQKPVMDYEIPESPENGTSLFDEGDSQPGTLERVGDNFMRHMILGLEFIPFDAFNFRVGYNYQRRKELQLEEVGGTVGFTWGFGLNLKRFSVDYGRAVYHMAGASNHFALRVDLAPLIPESLK